MQVLAVYGSPRRQGISSRLLAAMVAPFAKADWQVHSIHIADLSATPCTHCGQCQQTGHCPREDDFNAVLNQLQIADVILVASPVYFYSLPAQLKMLIDRCQPLWVRRFILQDSDLLAAPKRPCAFLSVAGAPETPRLFEGSRLVMQMWANTMGFELNPILTLADSDRLTEKALQGEAERLRQAGEQILAAYRC